MSFIGTPAVSEIGGRWKWFVVFGVVLAILGLIALYNAVDAAIVTTIFVGWLLVFGGIMQIVAAFTSGGGTGGRVLMVILGVLYVIVGFDLVADPLAGTLTLTLAVALILIADGVIRLVRTFMGPAGHRVLETFIAVVNIVLGIWLWTNIPVSALAIGFYVGFMLLFAGISWIVAGIIGRPSSQAPAQATPA